MIMAYQMQPPAKKEGVALALVLALALALTLAWGAHEL